MKYGAIVVSESDNVATALRSLVQNEDVPIQGAIQNIILRTNVPFGHKFAISDIKKGSPITKYGETIGQSTGDIEAGEHVHVHNVESLRGRGDK